VLRSDHHGRPIPAEPHSDSANPDALVGGFSLYRLLPTLQKSPSTASVQRKREQQKKGATWRWRTKVTRLRDNHTIARRRACPTLDRALKVSRLAHRRGSGITSEFSVSVSHEGFVRGRTDLLNDRPLAA
jgi:hypothetical protein